MGPTIPLVGDIGHIFSEMLKQESIAKVPENHSEWLNELYNTKGASDAKKAKKNSEYADPKTVIEAISRLMDENGVYVADVGQNQIWSCRYHQVRGGRFMTSGGMGTMGYAIPAAIGARIACPGRQVIAVCGDGAFAMSMMELATMNQENAGIKIVVMTNRRLGMVREYQTYHLDGRYPMVRIESEPDLELLARAYGLPYLKLDGGSDIDKVVTAFLRQYDAAILDVSVDPDEDTPR